MSPDDMRGSGEAGRNVFLQAECWSRPDCFHVVGKGVDLERSMCRIQIVTISEHRSNQGVRYRQQDEIQRRLRATRSSRLPWKQSMDATERATTSAAVASIEVGCLWVIGSAYKARIVVGCVFVDRMTSFPMSSAHQMQPSSTQRHSM